MDVFHTISAQSNAMNLPLFAVTLTAVPRSQTPLLLMLHWHAFRSQPDKATPLSERRLLSVPSSALQINKNWFDLSQIDQLMLDAAWQMGAWELARIERRGCNTIGAPEREALECRQAFGDDPLKPLGQTGAISEAPDREDMMHLGARVGYVQWSFRPVRGGIWQSTAEDNTLAPDGGRPPPCPVGAQPAAGHRVGKTRYRLGRIDRILLPA